jgi:toxin ParE1/3/4
MLNVTFSPAAEQDLSDILEFIAKDNKRAADRVANEVFVTLDVLCVNPEAGKVRQFKSPQLSGIHSYVLKQFHNYIVFYRLCAGNLEVIRLLHGARDFETLFEE